MKLFLTKNRRKSKFSLHRINQAEKSILSKEIDEGVAKNHHQLHLDFIKFERAFIEMKKGFKRFASHND